MLVLKNLEGLSGLNETFSVDGTSTAAMRPEGEDGIGK